MKMDFEPLLNAAQHLLVPINLEIGMQASLHQHSCAAEVHGLANLVVDRIELEDVSLFRLRPFQRTVKRAEGAVFGAEVRVIDVAINDVRDHTLGMELAAKGVGFHADADEIVGAVEVEGLGAGEGHVGFILADGGDVPPQSRAAGAASR
jgi:hypothetical protein